jgi:hypothetical protein
VSVPVAQLRTHDGDSMVEVLSMVMTGDDDGVYLRSGFPTHRTSSSRKNVQPFKGKHRSWIARSR